VILEGRGEERAREARREKVILEGRGEEEAAGGEAREGEQEPT
jgi:hypothetical protein